MYSKQKLFGECHARLHVSWVGCLGGKFKLQALSFCTKASMQRNDPKGGIISLLEKIAVLVNDPVLGII
jgi:hypothetical protein